ncbi:MAG: hypothetical protein QOE58_1331 [Actinomycetota bacterium]|jgi:hypothetical protein|nr:hypothetical protein [Actinomycetota bacterium]
MHKFTKKSVAVATGTVLLASGGGAAFAYWTNSGSGTGTATSGTNVAVTINQTAVTGLYPGQSAQTLAGTFNNSNAGATYVTAVTATGYTIDATHVTAGCLANAGHYTLGGTATVGANVPSGSAVGSWTGLTITMNNLGTNQDFCKGAIVTVTYASS